jgi:hypothetical protein
MMKKEGGGRRCSRPLGEVEEAHCISSAGSWYMQCGHAGLQACGLAGMRASVNLSRLSAINRRGEKREAEGDRHPETQGHRQKA